MSSSLEPGRRGHAYRASVDVSNLQSYRSPLSQFNRPASSLFETAQTPVRPQAGDSQLYDKWLDDIERYEATLENMASASLDSNFKEELGAIEQWFRVLSEAERTAALYSLLQQTTHVQIRFFIMILQQMSRQDPMGAILSPANFNKDIMSENHSHVRAQMSMRSAATPGFMSSAKQFDPSTISQMFPDAAAALASQRAELNRKKNLATPGPTPDVVVQPPNGADGVKIPWTPSFRRLPFEGPTRPRSAEPAKSAADVAKLTPGLRPQARHDLLGSNLPFSPFGEYAGPSGNWASMSNTPVSAMFPQPAQRPIDNMNAAKLAQRLSAASLNPIARASAPPSTFNAAANTARAIVDNDVRKFRRDSRKADDPKPPTGATSPIMIYDDDGQLMSPETAQMHASPLVQRQMGAAAATANNSFARSNSTSPAPPVSLGSAWLGAGSPFARGSNHVPSDALSPDTSSLGGDSSMLSNLSGQGRRRSNNGPSQSPTGGARTAVQENPADPRLLNDLPAWLRHLRLHKYTDNFRSTSWQQLVDYDDAKLQEMGVSALGARRKLLKAFESVHEAIAEGKLQK